MSGAGSSRQTLERSSSRWTTDSDVLISEDCGGIGDLNMAKSVLYYTAVTPTDILKKN